MTLPRPIISQEMVTPNQRVEPYRVPLVGQTWVMSVVVQLIIVDVD